MYVKNYGNINLEGKGMFNIHHILIIKVDKTLFWEKKNQINVPIFEEPATGRVPV